MLSNTSFGTSHYSLYWLFETMSYCAVNCYGLISGFFYNNHKYSLSKIVHMYSQVLFYSLVITLICILLGYNLTIDTTTIFKIIFPVAYKHYWYITAFFGLYFFMPLLSTAIDSLNEKQAFRCLIVFALVYSFYGSIVDQFVTSKGYSTLWLIILFVIGALMKKTNFLQSLSNKKMLFFLFLNTTFSWIVKVVFANQYFIKYISPTILITAMMLLVLFSRLSLDDKCFKPIIHISSATLGIYLFQNNFIIYSLIKNRFSFIANYNNVIIGTLSIFMSSMLVFFAGFVVEKIRQVIFSTKFIRKPLTVISEKMDSLLEIY